MCSSHPQPLVLPSSMEHPVLRILHVSPLNHQGITRPQCPPKTMTTTTTLIFERLVRYLTWMRCSYISLLLLFVFFLLLSFFSYLLSFIHSHSTTHTHSFVLYSITRYSSFIQTITIVILVIVIIIMVIGDSLVIIARTRWKIYLGTSKQVRQHDL
jgi:hypothetical protein